MPTPGTSDPGSADPTLRGHQTDTESLATDPSLGAPDRNFLQNEEAGSDGEPGAGTLGGTDEHYNAEMQTPDAEPADVDSVGDYPAEAPSTEAPVEDVLSGATGSDRESFSSEPGQEASGS